MSYDPARAISDRPPEAGFVVPWIQSELLPAFKSLRTLANALAAALNTGAFLFGGVTVRVVSGVPTTADVNGSVAFRIDGVAGSVFYHREAGAWVAIA